jgi:hypothetical protein
LKSFTWLPGDGVYWNHEIRRPKKATQKSDLCIFKFAGSMDCAAKQSGHIALTAHF